MVNSQILSPVPGIFYDKASPEDPPYKSVGDSVTEGDVIGLIEIMKSFHEVKSAVSGTLSTYLVDNEDAVQAGQPIADIEV